MLCAMDYMLAKVDAPQKGGLPRRLAAGSINANAKRP
jgi:hypothetical protein